MWMSNDRVPLENVESPYGGGVSSLPSAAGDLLPVMFPVAPVLLAGGPQLGFWQVAVVRVDETPAGDFSGREYPCAKQNRHWPIDISELPDGLGHTVVEGGPVGPEVIEPLEQLVLDHADPAGQHAVIRDTTRLLEHPLTRPDSSLGDRLVEKILDWEPAARPVPDTTLEGRLREGNTYLEHSAPVVSLDSGLMEGMSCLEPLEQSILHSLLVARPSICVMEERSEWKPVINPVHCFTLDGRLREGNTYLERSTLGVSLDSGLTEGAFCQEPLEQSVLSLPLVARHIEGITEKVPEAGDKPGSGHYPDGRPMEGTAYPEHSALGVSVDSGLRAGMSSLEPLQQSVLNTSLVARPEAGIMTSDWKLVINPVQDITPDGRPMEGLPTRSIRLWGCLWTVDSGRGC